MDCTELLGRNCVQALGAQIPNSLKAYLDTVSLKGRVGSAFISWSATSTHITTAVFERDASHVQTLTNRALGRPASPSVYFLRPLPYAGHRYSCFELLHSFVRAFGPLKNHHRPYRWSIEERRIPETKNHIRQPTVVDTSPATTQQATTHARTQRCSKPSIDGR